MILLAFLLIAPWNLWCSALKKARHVSDSSAQKTTQMAVNFTFKENDIFETIYMESTSSLNTNLNRHKWCITLLSPTDCYKNHSHF